jgi:hypothetical protein
MSYARTLNPTLSYDALEVKLSALSSLYNTACMKSGTLLKMLVSDTRPSHT